MREKRPVIYRFPDEVVRRLLPDWCDGQDSAMVTPEPADVGLVRFDPRPREIWFPGGIDLQLSRKAFPSSSATLWKVSVVVKRTSGYYEAALPLLRGFLSSLLFKTPEDLVYDNRLALNQWEGQSEPRWPRIVPDAVWSQIWQLEPPPANPTEQHRSGDAPMMDFGVKDRRLFALDDVLDEVPLEEVLFQTTSDPDSPTRICWKDAGAYRAVSGAHTEHGTWHELLDGFAKRSLLIPAASMPRWEEENVVYGTWVLPTQDEVDIYRLMGEELPFLWPDEQLDAWLLERS